MPFWKKAFPVLMTNFSRILNTLTGMHFEDRNQFINSLNRYSLLIIDDLGIELILPFTIDGHNPHAHILFLLSDH